MVVKLVNSKKIRAIWDEEEQQWYFVVNDIAHLLSNYFDGGEFIRKLRNKDMQLFRLWKDIIKPIKLIIRNQTQEVSCTNAQGFLRIIMAASGPKAEVFKLWMTQLAVQHLTEMYDPDKAIKRLNSIYQQTGKPYRLKKEPITTPIKNNTPEKQIIVNDLLLTDEIAKASLGLSYNEILQLGKNRKQYKITELDYFLFMLDGFAKRLNKDESKKIIKKAKQNKSAKK